MSLKKVGFFFELPEDDQRKELSRLRRSEGSLNESKIVNYLTTGIDTGVAMIIERDLLSDPPKPLGEAVLKSDGEWVWPVSLAYYVSTYHVDLPDEFVEVMARNAWRVREDVELSSEFPEGHVEM